MKYLLSTSLPQAVILSLMGDNDLNSTLTSLKMLGINETNLTPVFTTSRNEWLIENGFSKVNDNLFFKEGNNLDYIFVLTSGTIFINSFFKIVKVISETGSIEFPSEFSQLLEEEKLVKSQDEIRYLLDFINPRYNDAATLSIFDWTFRSSMSNMAFLDDSPWYVSRDFNIRLKSAWLHCKVVKHMSSWGPSQSNYFNIYTVCKDTDIQSPSDDTIAELVKSIDTCHKLGLIDIDSDIDMSALSSWEELQQKLEGLIKTAADSFEQRYVKLLNVEEAMRDSVKPIAVIKEPGNKETDKYNSIDSLYNKIALFAIFIAALILLHNCKG